MIFNATERTILAGLADVLIPAGNGMPSASEAGIANEGLDRVLTVRPEIADVLESILQMADGRGSERVIAELQTNHPDAFGVLAEFAAAAYFLNAEVRKAIGYQGQTPHPIDPNPDYLEDGLLQSVMDRGLIYRPTGD
ncbi:MAG: hypothetical protein O2960_04710 [Verrucomicrobia bacterium]|nr:hypothetical protein [Verrucomicrobiota bacterium]